MSITCLFLLLFLNKKQTSYILHRQKIRVFSLFFSLFFPFFFLVMFLCAFGAFIYVFVHIHWMLMWQLNLTTHDITSHVACHVSKSKTTWPFVWYMLSFRYYTNFLSKIIGKYSIPMKHSFKFIMHVRFSSFFLN
jgi:hypothetical protein